MKPRRKNKIEWSSELAYAIGLITTDGSLSVDKRHIEFSSQDLALIKTFKKCLGLKNKIGYKINSFSDKKFPRVQFGDVALYGWLLKIGLTPNKSKTVRELKVPNRYFFDFLRGFFDGDGSCYSYWDTRWTNSFMFYTIFCSASLSCIKWLKQKTYNLCGIKGHITKGSRVWQLKYAKMESKTLISKMYYKENLPCLKRKYKKLKAILQINKKEENRKLKSHGRVMESVDICA